METTSGRARTPADEFIESARVFLRDDYLPKLLHCMEEMKDEDLWWRPNEASNSAGNLMLHLCGNVRQWIVSSIAGTEFKRNRDAEFAEKGPVPKVELVSNMKQVLREVDDVLAGIHANQLTQTLKIQKYETTTLQAIFHVVEHFSYHLGQILYIYKLRTGVDAHFYEL